jgi:hypothetical protein
MPSRLRTAWSRFAAAIATAALFAASPAAAIDIVVGDVTVDDLTAYGFTQFSSALSFDGGTTDQVYEMFGYVGTTSGTVKIDPSSFSVVSPIAQVGNSAQSTLRLEAAAAATLGLSDGAILIDYVFTLMDDTGAQDEDGFGWDITLSNTTGADIPLVLYTYLDLDLGGAADWFDDMATIDLGRAVVTDADDPAALFVWNQTVGGRIADHFAVGAYPGVRATLDTMGAAQDLSDTMNPFGPADFTAAYQFDFLVAAGSSVTSSSSTSIAPEPDSAVLTALGLMGLTVSGRRRKLPLS